MYGNVDDLREQSQITANDLYLRPRAGEDDEDAFNRILTQRLVTASEIINADRKRDFDEERRLGIGPVPELVHEAALKIAGNMMEHMIDQQNSKRIQREDPQGNLGFPTSKFIDSDTRSLLDMIPHGDKLYGLGWPRITRLRSAEQIEEEAVL